ncbi:MAG: rRNA maturation RNase YbeY [Smithella sp.]|jgi:probable rRNA maturation factor
MKIHIENNQNKSKIERRRIRSTVSRVFRILECPDKEVSIFFTDDNNIRELNKKYLGRDKATNVLSFSLREGEYGDINPQMMGDIVISVDTAQKDARKGNLTFEQEIDFLLIHGILHLLGYNHENTSPAKAKEMGEKQKELFNKINCSTGALL